MPRRLTPEDSRGSTGSAADCGTNFSEWFARYTPDGWLSRTSAPSLFEEPQEYLRTLPAQGSMRTGRLYPQAPWAPPTIGKDSSSSPGGQSDSRTKCGSASAAKKNCIATSAGSTTRIAGTPARIAGKNFWRTPTARDWKGMSAASWRSRTVGDKTPTLPDQIGGVPHPEFVEELMGFPIGWTALEDSGTRSSRKLRS